MLIGPIDLAINRYAFCGSDGANLHTKFSETYQITLKQLLTTITIFFCSGGANLHRPTKFSEAQ